MKNLLIIFLLIFVSSCATQKRCYQKFPPQTVTVTKDSIRTEIVYRDTTIYVTLPVETITKTDTIYVKNGSVIFNPVEVETNYAYAKAWTGQNRINLTLTDKDTTLIFRLNKAIKEAKYYEMKYSTEKKTVIEYRTKKFVKVMAWIGGVSILLLVLLILRKFKIV